MSLNISGIKYYFYHTIQVINILISLPRTRYKWLSKLNPTNQWLTSWSITIEKRELQSDRENWRLLISNIKKSIRYFSAKFRCVIKKSINIKSTKSIVYRKKNRF